MPTDSDIFQIAFIGKIPMHERQSLGTFVTARCAAGDDVNCRSIREWIALWRASIS